MRRSFLLIFALWLAAAASLHAQFSWNPVDWFIGDDEGELTAFHAPSEAEEADASNMLNQGKAKFERGNLGGANRIFKKVAKNYPTTTAAGDALYMQGRIYMTKGRWDKAFERLQTVIDEHQNYPGFNRVLSAQFECATALMEGARYKLFGVIPTVRQYKKSITFFEGIASNAPYGDYAPLSLMNIALVAQQLEDEDVAIDALDRIINFYPQSMLAPDAYLNLAKTYANLVQGFEYDQGSTRQAVSYYEDFLVLFPNSPSAGEVEANLAEMENLLSQSRLNLGDFYYFYRSNNTAALVFYNEAITIAPESDSAAEAKLRIADIEAGVRPATGAQIIRSLFFIN